MSDSEQDTVDVHAQQFGVKRIRETYRRGMFEGETPDFPVSYETLREEAFERMSWKAKAYVHGGPARTRRSGETRTSPAGVSSRGCSAGSRTAT